MIGAVIAPLSPPGPALACRACGARVASARDTIVVLGRPVRATYTNPAGVACEILTLEAAENLLRDPFSTEAHTWFEGYAWRPVGCAKCGAHLGWEYESPAPGAEPPRFYGLLTTALTEVAEAGRDM